MTALSREQRSPVETVMQWFRGLVKREVIELKCLGDDEVERIAGDLSLSASELRKLVAQGPEGAALLSKRMDALDLDRNEVAKAERATFRDLQRVCTMCDVKRRCARDLAHHSADPKWKDYCPNAATLIALNSLPWSSRSQW